MATFIEYAGAAVISALPALALIGLCENPAKEPQLRPSTDPIVMVWSYPGEYQARNFKDAKPYCSLDEVVLRTQDGRVITLSSDDEGFNEQEKFFQERIVPYLRK